MTPYARPDVLKSKTVEIMVGCGSLYVTMCFKDDDRFKEPPINEVWIEANFKMTSDDDIQAYCIKSSLIPMSRLITFALRRIKDDERDDLIKQIHKHECPKRSIVTAKSCADAVARVLLCHWQGHKIKNGRCWVCGRTKMGGENEKKKG